MAAHDADATVSKNDILKEFLHVTTYCFHSVTYTIKTDDEIFRNDYLCNDQTYLSYLESGFMPKYILEIYEILPKLQYRRISLDWVLRSELLNDFRQF